MSQPVRIDAELLDSAKRAGRAQGRSAAQQLAFWAQVGRQLEASTSLSIREHRNVAEAALTYDDLDPLEQAVERAAWEAAIAEDIASADWAADFAAEGMPYAVIADADGKPTRVDPAAFTKPAAPAEGSRARGVVRTGGKRFTAPAPEEPLTFVVHGPDGKIWEVTGQVVAETNNVGTIVKAITGGFKKVSRAGGIKIGGVHAREVTGPAASKFYKSGAGVTGSKSARKSTKGKKTRVIDIPHE